jgi:lipoate-protein ligase B|tara:strand:- start:888 stop:1613 length:726 start_codon:yes stop_codon:yes gene_type:complete
MHEIKTPPHSRSLSVWLAGQIHYDSYALMAEKLAWEISESGSRLPTLILYELKPIITVGRSGSRVDINLTDEELCSHRLDIRYVGRGGGAVLHGPGQIGVSLFVTMQDLGFDEYDVGGFIDCFELSLESAVRQVRCAAARDSKHAGIFGRTGLLASVGVAIRRGVIWHGGFLNVEKNTLPVHRVQTSPFASSRTLRTMSCMEVDVQRRIRLQDVRSALVHSIVDSFRFPQPQIHSGFPLPL